MRFFLHSCSLRFLGPQRAQPLSSKCLCGGGVLGILPIPITPIISWTVFSICHIHPYFSAKALHFRPIRSPSQAHNMCPSTCLFFCTEGPRLE